MSTQGQRPDVRGVTSEPFAVSGFLDGPDQVDDALIHLNEAGVPSDLVEVIVSTEGAERYYPSSARAPGSEALRYAGIGGLAGLITGSIVSLVLVAMPGFLEAGITAIAQLIGPNLATVGGAALGAVIGLFVRRRAEHRHRRIAEAPDRILLVVTTRSREEAGHLIRLLGSAGAHDVRLEP